MRTLIIAAALALTPFAASAQQAPQFDARPGCQAGARSGVSVTPDVEACLRTEMRARDEMNAHWGGFAAADKQRCVAKTNLGGPPSYVEVLTCLELARDVRNMPKEDNTGLSNGMQR